MIVRPPMIFETTTKGCKLEILGEKYNAVLTELHMASFGMDVNNQEVQYEAIKRSFRLEKPVAFWQIFVPVIFNGKEIKCYQGGDRRSLIEM